MKEYGVKLVVADIPALPLAIAASLGIPCMAVGNFAWDWIYSAYAARSPRWKLIADMFREEYSKTDLLLRLPFCDEMKAFPRVEDIPLVASPGRERRTEIAAHAQCDPAKKWILLSFATLDWNDAALESVERLEQYEFFTVRPLEWRRRNMHPIDREEISFVDVLASMDAVISKPGYGILSDCVVNRKPLIYADRSDFLEYPILEDAIHKYLKYLHIPAANLYRGDLSPSLERIWDRPGAAMTLAQGGAAIAG